METDSGCWREAGIRLMRPRKGGGGPPIVRGRGREKERGMESEHRRINAGAEGGYAAETRGVWRHCADWVTVERGAPGDLGWGLGPRGAGLKRSTLTSQSLKLNSRLR